MAGFAVRRNLAAIVTRILSSSSSCSSSSSLASRYRYAFAFLDKHLQPVPDTIKIQTRFRTSKSGYSPLNDSSPNFSNRPPRETILLDGCDYEHWLIVMEFPTDPKPSQDEMVHAYIKTLAAVVGGEEEAKKKIYSVSTMTYTGFGALVSEEVANKLKGLPGVLWVLPDSYLDVQNKDYGGDLFIDGKVIQRPQYWYTDSNQRPARTRARYDRGREPRQVERRTPMQRQSTGQGQGHQQPASGNSQNSTQG